jgi:hypothetical protein
MNLSYIERGFYSRTEIFLSARILQIRLFFHKRKDFLNTPGFWQKQGFLKSA